MSVQQQLLGRFTSLESDTPAAGGVADALEVGQVVDEDGAQLDGENLVENDLLEASEDADVVDEGSDDVEELIDTSEALESFLAAARSASKQGGWSTQEAAAYDLGINIVMSKIGGGSRDVMPSLESFGSSRERINATASVENRITDTLKKIWEAIKRAVNKVIAFVRKWYLKIADGATRLKKRAEAIRKKAESTQGTAKEKKIRIPMAGLHLSKNAPNAGQLKSALGSVTGLINDLTKGRAAKGYADACDGIVAALEAVADGSAENGKTALGKVYAATGDFTAFESDAAAKAKFPGATESMSGVSLKGGELPGGKKLIAVTLTKGIKELDDKEISAVGRSAFKIALVDASDKKVEVDSSKEVQILEPQEVVSLADDVISLADAVIDYRKEFENYERKSKDTLSKVDKIANKSGKGDSDAENANIATARALANFAGNALRNHGSSVTNVINYGLGLARNALVYGNSSLNQYKAD